MKVVFPFVKAPQIPLYREIRRVYPAEPLETETEGIMASEIELLEETENERVESWRAEELERAGYDPSDAAKLAVRHDVDLHLAIGLLREGCPAATALRILL